MTCQKNLLQLQLLPHLLPHLPLTPQLSAICIPTPSTPYWISQQNLQWPPWLDPTAPFCSPSHMTLTSHFHSGAASFLKHFLLASDLSFIGFFPLPLWSHLLLTTLLLFATKIQCWLLVQSFSLFSLCVLLISNFFLLHSFNHHLPTQRKSPWSSRIPTYLLVVSTVPQTQHNQKSNHDHLSQSVPFQGLLISRWPGQLLNMLNRNLGLISDMSLGLATHMESITKALTLPPQPSVNPSVSKPGL